MYLPAGPEGQPGCLSLVSLPGRVLIRGLVSAIPDREAIDLVTTHAVKEWMTARAAGPCRPQRRGAGRWAVRQEMTIR